MLRQIPSRLFSQQRLLSLMSNPQIVMPPHIPVMANEVIEYLQPEKNKLVIDMTFGAGGHTKKILESSDKIKVIALDRDPTAHQFALKMQEQYPDRLFPILGRFSELPELLKILNIKQSSVDAFLFDFGCSSMQFDEGDRGFAISKNGFLDMRMDKDRFPEQPTAAEILTKIEEEDLARIIKVYGEEKHAKKIARAIIDARHSIKNIETTKELADLVYAVTGGEIRVDKMDRPSHVATKTFQAIRIFVNNELNEINYGINLAEKYLKIGGRLLTITFHSLEDTIVKRHLMGNIIDDNANPIPLKYSSHMLSFDKEKIEVMMESNWRQLHKHVIIPKFEEIEENPRSRSAKFRAAVRIR
jgi:16S rRNA (cytosine(1402)-N(4))-methyltransferase